MCLVVWWMINIDYSVWARKNSSMILNSQKYNVHKFAKLNSEIINTLVDLSFHWKLPRHSDNQAKILMYPQKIKLQRRCENCLKVLIT